MQPEKQGFHAPYTPRFKNNYGTLSYKAILRLVDETVLNYPPFIFLTERKKKCGRTKNVSRVAVKTTIEMEENCIVSGMIS